MNVTLSPEFERYIEQKVRDGQYPSAREILQDALRLLKEQEEEQQKLEELRREIRIGLDQADRGEVALLDMEAIKAEARRRFESRNR